MGYYYTGDFTISVPVETAVAVALDQPSLIATMRGTWSGRGVSDNPFNSANTTGATLVDRMLDYLSFEISEQETDMEGTVRYTGSVSQKFGDDVDAILLFLGNHGAGVDMSCTGEDGERWAYQASVRSHTANVESLVSVPKSEWDQARAARETVQRVSAFLTSHRETLPAEVASELAALLEATVPTM
jgi:hypothetical protein